MESGIPAWMICEDILNKAKDELITEAIDTLNREKEAKRIAVNGSIITLPDKPTEIWQDLFVIRNLMNERENVERAYNKYLHEKGKDPKKMGADTVLAMENLNKFLLSLNQMHMLMHVSEVFEGWITSVSKEARIDDPVEIIKKTLNEHREARLEALEFVLESKIFIKEGILDKHERKLLERVLETEKG